MEDAQSECNEIRCPDPQCGHTNPAGARHCAQCGRLLDSGVPRWVDWVCMLVLAIWLVQFGYMFIRALT